jgi:hypothetical protein
MTDIELYDFLISKIRLFANKKGINQFDIKNKAGILCSTIKMDNILKFEYDGLTYGAPQTTMLWMSEQIDNSSDGLFTIFEPHYMNNDEINKEYTIEFLIHGGEIISDRILTEIMNMFGFSAPMYLNYGDVLKKYSVEKVTQEIKNRFIGTLSNVVGIKNFPMNEDLNWYTNTYSNYQDKKEVILNGFTTIICEQINPNLIKSFEKVDKTNLIKEFGEDRVNSEIKKIRNIETQEVFLCTIKLNELAKSFQKKD